MNQTHPETEVFQSVRDCFQTLGRISIRRGERDRGPDFTATLKLADGTTKHILIEFKELGQPRFARVAVDQLQNWLTNHPGSYGLFVAPYISPQSAKICDENGIGYLDFAGNCLIRFDHMYIERTGRKNLAKRKYPIRSLYHPKAERILRVLLENPQTIWRIEALAKESQVSVGQVHNVKDMLVNEEWATFDRSGLKVKNAGAILDDWSEHYDFDRNSVEACYILGTSAEIESRIETACNETQTPFAFTAFSAAMRYAPFSRYREVSVYVADAAALLNQLTDAKRVATGPNLNLIQPYDDGVLYTTNTDRKDCVSATQTYLDLMHFGERGQEAANFLRRERIDARWR